MMITATAPQSSLLPAASAFSARPRLDQPAWRELSAELVVTADERNRFGAAVYGATPATNGGTTATGNDRSFAICGMHVPAFAKKEHSQRKRTT